MKVGMYNRWLATLGGGERHSLAIAEFLSHDHEVHVISHVFVPKETVESRLNLDLSKVIFDVIPSQGPIELQPITKEFDLFINASFMEFLPSLSPHSAALIFFPAPLENAPNIPFRYRIGWVVKQMFKLPTLTNGYVRGSRSVNRKYELECNSIVQWKLPISSEGYLLSFSTAARAPGIKQLLILLDNKIVGTIERPDPDFFHQILIQIPGSPLRRRELKISTGENEEGLPTDVKIAVSNLTIHHWRFKIYQMIFEHLLPGLAYRFHLLPLPARHILDQMDSYDDLWANSEFTRSWIRKYWNRESHVLYPPIDVEKFHPGKKINQILGVGRFFVGDHNKKHPFMIQAFKEMVDEGLTGWELHLAGGRTPGDVHEKYIQDILKSIEGYPIFVHLDLPFERLVDLYSISSIYWHAAGIDEDEKQFPHRFEHFGITTVEAMASGCVPVVVGRGGQTEIVRNHQNGFLWQNMPELKKATLKLIRDKNLLERLSNQAWLDSKKYSKENFHTKLKALLGLIGVQKP